MAISSDAPSSMRAVLAAIAANATVTVAKFVGWLFSMSPSMLSESIHSLADTINQILLLIGIKQSKQGPTALFPWGQGQARYLWNLISAMGVFFLGCGFTLYHALSALFNEQEPLTSRQFQIAVLILILSFFIELWSLWVAHKELKHKISADKGGFWHYLFHGDDPTGVGVLFEDFVACVGIIVALIGLCISELTGNHIFDIIAAIIISLMLGAMAIILSKVNGRLLLGRATSPKREEEILNFLHSVPSIKKVVSFRTEVLGSNLLRVSMEVDFNSHELYKGMDPSNSSPKLWIKKVGSEINKIEQLVQNEFAEVVAIAIEVN